MVVVDAAQLREEGKEEEGAEDDKLQKKLVVEKEDTNADKLKKVEGEELQKKVVEEDVSADKLQKRGWRTPPMTSCKRRRWL